MSKRYAFTGSGSRIPAFFLAFFLIFAASPAAIFASNPQIGSETDAGQASGGSGEIIEFAEIDTKAIFAPLGTPVSVLPLPERIAATVLPSGAATPTVAGADVVEADISVTWKPDRDYNDGDTEGEYIFTAAVRDEGYTVADYAVLPAVSVVVGGGKYGSPIYFTPGESVADEKLLSGILAVDRHGDEAKISVRDIGGLDRNGAELSGEPYIITYAVTAADEGGLEPSEETTASSANEPTESTNESASSEGGPDAAKTDPARSATPTDSDKSFTVTRDAFVVNRSFMAARSALTRAETRTEPYSGAFDMVADGDTSDSYKDIFDSYSPANDGRVWTDKTVRLGDEGTAEADEFKVMFSAMAQAVQREREEIVPSDTVFVLDISASMVTNKLDNGRSRIDMLLEALNKTIDTLMSENDSNRIAVVAFGGGPDRQTARLVKILKLDRYDDVSGPLFELPTPARMRVNLEKGDERLFDSTNPIINVEGGTPTQWGIREGAGVLIDDNPVDYTYGVDRNEPPTPNIVLLTDGEPTFGWKDYTFSDGAYTPGPNSESFSSGNGNDVDMGPEILTALTASYFKQEVSKHYYGAMTDTSKMAKAGFYTLGLGVKDSDDARATLDPAGVTDGLVNASKISYRYGTGDDPTATYNMLDILEHFIRVGTVDFPTLVKKNQGTSKAAHELITVENPAGASPAVDPVTSYNYVDYYGAAETSSELATFLEGITEKIITAGYYPTSVIDDPTGMYNSTHTSYADYSGAVVFSDVIGEYMELKGFDHLLYRGEEYNGAIFAHRIAQENGGSLNGGITGAGPTTTKLLNTMFASQLFFRNISEEHTSEAAVEELVRNLLDSCLRAGNGGGDPGEYGIYYNSATDFGNRIRFYADADGTWVANYFDDSGKPVSPAPTDAECIVDQYYVNGATHNTVSGNPSDLTYSIFEVITALGDIDVAETNFTVSAANDIQPETVETRKLKDGQQMARWIIPASLLPLRSVSEAGAVTEADPIRFVYSVGLRGDLTPDGLTPNQNFYSNEWDANDTLAHFIPGAHNPYYNKGGGTGEGDVPKYENPTETAGYSTGAPRITSSVWYYPLGNNGRLTPPLTKLTVKKNWDPKIAAEDQIDVYIQLYYNSNPVGEPKGIAASGPYTTEEWTGLPIYELDADESGMTKPRQYLIKEGTWDESAFTAYDDFYDADNDGDSADNGDFHITYSQPAFDGTEMTATVNNNFPSDYTWALNIKKRFELNGEDASRELEAKLRQQKTSIEFIPLIQFVYGTDGTEGVSTFTALRGEDETQRLEIRYPEHFINGECNVLECNVLLYLSEEYVNNAVDENNQPMPKPTAINVLLVEKETAIDGYEWDAPNGDGAVPEGMSDAVKYYMANKTDDSYIEKVEGITNDDTIYVFATADVKIRDTASFDITNNLTAVEPPPPPASLRITKNINGIEDDDFAATFVVEGWADNSDPDGRTAGNRIYYNSVEYDGDQILLKNIPAPGYYRVTENTADSVRVTDDSDPDGGDPITLTFVKTLTASGADVRVIDNRTVEFRLDEGDGEIEITLTNDYAVPHDPPPGDGGDPPSDDDPPGSGDPPSDDDPPGGGDPPNDSNPPGHGGNDDGDDDTPPRNPDRPRYDLTVKKTVTDEAGNPDTQKLFRFQAVYTGAASVPYGDGAIPLSIEPAPGAVRVSGTGIDESRIQRDSQGRPTVLLLKHGETATLKGLYGGSYRIAELDRDGYDTVYTIGTGQTNAVTASGETREFILRENATVSFINTAASTAADTPPDMSADTLPDTLPRSNPDTGDSNNTALWVTILILSSTGSATLIVWRKRRGRRNTGTQTKVKALSFTALLVVLLFAGILAAVQIVSIQLSYSGAREEYDALRQYAPAVPRIELAVLEPPQPAQPVSKSKVSAEELLKINPDYIGWLRIEGADIDYPVVRGTDNERYLTASFSGEENASGAIFMDAGCTEDFNSPFAVLYGHNMNDGSMFSNLNDYMDVAGNEDLSVSVITATGETLAYRIVYARVTDVYDAAYALIGKDIEAVREYIDKASIHAPQDVARVLALSTCTNSGDDDERLLVFAVAG